LSQFRIRRAADTVGRGGLIAYPTEAVYGLGCDPLNGDAVTQLCALKHRSANKGLILVAASVDQLLPYLAPISQSQWRPVLATWPGAVTWLLPAAKHVPWWLCGEHDTLAVRVSAHPLIRALCQRSQSPLVSTSANIVGKPPQTRALGVRRIFGDQLQYILSGATGGFAKPTEIRRLSGVVVRRSGAPKLD
jgi:L-threonylcarbamoyladenylate synthase